MGHFHFGQGDAAVIFAHKAHNIILGDQPLGNGRASLGQPLGIAEDQLHLFAEHAAGFVHFVDGHFGRLAHFCAALI